jgi:hypothetical protein
VTCSSRLSLEGLSPTFTVIADVAVVIVLLLFIGSIQEDAQITSMWRVGREP